MVDLNSMELSKIYDCIEFWCDICDLNDENKDTLKKTAKNLNASKNIRISEYLNGGNYGNFNFIDKFKSSKKSLIAEPDLEISKSILSKEEKESVKASRIRTNFKKMLK
ncbi:hypothetical protein MHBO_000408 [Bonamia ostreae]